MNEAERRKGLKKAIETGVLPVDFDIEGEIQCLNQHDRDDLRLAAYREIVDAYGLVGPHTGTCWSGPIQTRALAGLVIRWIEGRESAALDDALEYCYIRGLPVLPALLRHVVDAVRQRRSKAKSPLSPAMRYGIKDEAFRGIANLVCVGVTFDRACEVSAVLSAQTGHPFKASTLHKDYPKVWKNGKPSLEDLLRAERQRLPNPAQDEAWREIEKRTPAPTQEQKGER